MNFQEALNTLNLEAPFDLIQLKAAYRDMIRKWHPDVNRDRPKKATEMAQLINSAYDLLKDCSHVKADFGGKHWTDYLKSQLPKWEKEFKQGWRNAYANASTGEAYAGMHLFTYIQNFKRGHIEPRPEWFRGVLFPDDAPSNRVKYRELLLKIAPNQKMREEWARKYFTLEFGESTWIFYLPPCKQMLRAG